MRKIKAVLTMIAISALLSGCGKNAQDDGKILADADVATVDEVKNFSAYALGHDYMEATCEKAATCKRCGATTGKEKGHVYSAQVSCTEAQKCTKCGKVIQEATGHVYDRHAYAATSKREGYMEYTCNVCGYSYQTTDYKGPYSGMPVSANISDEEIYKRVIALKSKYPQGSKWNVKDKYTFQVGRMVYYYGGCSSFAALLQDEIWEGYPITKYTDVNQIRVGDQVRYVNRTAGYGHRVFILAIDSAGYHLAEGNIGSNGNGTVSWTRVMSKKDMESMFDFGWTRR